MVGAKVKPAAAPAAAMVVWVPIAQPMTTSSLSGAKSTATVTPWPGRQAWPVTVAGGVAATGAGATGAVAAISDRVIRGSSGVVEVRDQVEQQDGVDGERAAVDAGLGEGPGRCRAVRPVGRRWC